MDYGLILVDMIKSLFKTIFVFALIVVLVAAVYFGISAYHRATYLPKCIVTCRDAGYKTAEVTTSFWLRPECVCAETFAVD